MRIILTVVFACTGLAMPAAARAAPNVEVTVQPLGNANLKPGKQTITRRLPGAKALVRQPLVLIAAQPHVGEHDADALPWDVPANPRRQVPASLKIKVAGQALPTWKLTPKAQMYVVNLDILTKATSGFQSRALKLELDLETEAEGLRLGVLCMPDPALAGHAHNGLLSTLEKNSTDQTVKEYLRALSHEVAGEYDPARVAYQRLAQSSHQRVARLARRGLRLLRYQTRKYKLSGNALEHFRWGLYLQYCGFYEAAFKEFEECGLVDPANDDAYFRAGECLDRVGGPIMTWIHYMDRAGEPIDLSRSTIFNFLVVIEKKRNNRALSAEEITRIKETWMLVEKIAWASTHGMLRISTKFEEIAGGQLVNHSNIPGPKDALIETRGWFDAIVTVRPRTKQAKAADVESAGSEVGPGGTALACVAHDADWQTYLKAVYGILSRAAIGVNVEPGIPSLQAVLDCGFRPVPHEADAYRSALRYHFTPNASRSVNIGEVSVAGSYLNLWKLEGPFTVPNGKAIAVADKINRAAPRTLTCVSNEDFVDLTQHFENAGSALVRATAWVYSPDQREVFMRVGRNDAAAVWLNNRLVFADGRLVAGKLRDRNVVDTVLAVVNLHEGWNEVRTVVQSHVQADNKNWGFSIAFTTLDGNLVPGLSNVNQRPTANLVKLPDLARGAYYSWSEVGDDYKNQLPELGDGDLAAHTGIAGLKVVSRIRDGRGYVAVSTMAKQPGRFRTTPQSWNPETDHDFELNNVIDWEREGCAALRYRSGSQSRDLLLLRPEAITPFLTLLGEPDSAARLFNGLAFADRILGYVVIPVGDSTRTLLVADALLSDGPDWPIDEEDLLSPVRIFVPNLSSVDEGPMPENAGEAPVSPGN